MRGRDVLRDEIGLRHRSLEHNGRHRVRRSTRSPRPAMRAGLAALTGGALVAAMLASSVASASADEGPRSSSVTVAAKGDDNEPKKVSNGRAPRVTEEDLADDGLLPWESQAAADIRGYRASLYTGAFHDKRFDQYRLCVVQRESGGRYDLTTGTFHGAYQFGGAYNTSSRVADRMRAELVAEYGSEATVELNRLARTPIYSWNRYWQDAAFWTTFNRGAGWRQWSAEWGASWNCDHRANAERGWPRSSLRNFEPIKKGGESVPASTRSTRSTAAHAVVTTASTREPRVVQKRFGRSPHSLGSPDYSRWLAKKYIRAEYGWKLQEFRALNKMWWRESNWRYEVVNWHPRGPWYGLGQVNGGFINGQGYSIEEYRNTPYFQIVVGAAYIKYRYGSPSAAWQFWLANGWY